MGALTIAFDTIIVGALALPWVYLVIHLFFFEGENRLQGILDWIQTKNLQAVAAVLLFSITYTLGSAIERVAQDFFNDDDLHIPGTFRMTITEDRIIASVFCESDANLVQLSSPTHPAVADGLKALQWETRNCCNNDEKPKHETPSATGEPKKPAFRAHRFQSCPEASTGTESAVESDMPEITAWHPSCPCQSIVRGFGGYAADDWHGKTEDHLIDTTRDVFGVQENGLLLQGEDDTLRLRQLHDQIMVLRGATFNGLVAFALCLFAWGVRARRQKSRILQIVLAVVPGIFLLLFVQAFHHHMFVQKEFAHPPYMEFSLFAVGAAGAFLLWLKPLWWRLKALWFHTQKHPAHAAGPGRSSDPMEGQDCFLRWKWGLLSAIFAALFVAGVLGWWATEVLYAEQIIYSYDSQITTDAKPATAGQKELSSGKE